MSGVQRVDDTRAGGDGGRTPTWPRPTIRRTSRAMRLLAKELPQIPLVAAFETGFHETIAAGRAAVRRAARVGGEARHSALGLSRGQPSLHRRAHGSAAEERRGADHLVPPRRQQFAVRDRGRASRSATSLGMSPQSGLPHNNRVGDFDVFALPALMRATGKTLEQLLDDLANRSGLARPQRAQRPARHRGGGRKGRRALATGVRRVRGRRCGTTSAPICCCWAGPTPSCSPAASARTRRRMRAAVCANLDWFGIAPRSGAERDGARAKWRSTRPAAACSCGSCRPTRS